MGVNRRPRTPPKSQTRQDPEKFSQFVRNFVRGGGFIPRYMDDFGPRDPLWQLLGKSRSRAAGPFFAARVANSIDSCASTGCRGRPAGFLGWLRILIPAAACVAVAAIAFVETLSPHDRALAMADPLAEFEMIANLDLLLTQSEAELWLRNSPADSLF